MKLCRSQILPQLIGKVLLLIAERANFDAARCLPSERSHREHSAIECRNEKFDYVNDEVMADTLTFESNKCIQLEANTGQRGKSFQ